MEGATATGGASAPLAGGVSIEDELDAIFDGLLAERKPEIFELPGWGRKLMAKYRVLEQEEGEEIGKRVAEQVSAGEIDNLPLTILIDGLVKSCVGFYTEREVDGERKILPLNETLTQPTEKPIKWDRELAAVFRKKLEKVFGTEDISKLTARQIVRGVLKNDDRLVHRHGTEVNRWSERELEAVHSDF